MILTLKDVLKLGRLNECEVLSGHAGLDRKVTSITILEVPEVTNWLKKGELLLTSFYNLQDDDEALRKLINQINSIGAAGLAIKPSNYIGEMPEVILQESEKLSLPIIFIPENINYAEILYPVVHRLFDDKVILQEDVKLATSTLEELLVNGDSIDDFLRNIEAILQTSVTIESGISGFNFNLSDINFKKLTFKEESRLEQLKKTLRIERESDDKIFDCLVAPILIEGKYMGNVTVWDISENMITFDYAVVEKASNLLSIELLKILIEQDIKINHENDFLREILFSSSFHQKYLKEFSDAFNLDHESDYYSILIEAYNDGMLNSSKIQESRFYSFVKADKDNILVGRIENYYCIIRSSKYVKEEIELYCDKLYKNFSSLLKYFAIGEMKKGLKGIQKSFEQAKYSMDFAGVIDKEKRIIFYDELGAYKLIHIWDGKKELDEFYHSIFSSILLDKKAEELIETLQLYFLNDGRLKMTSEKLYIHINTLKYRIKKIEKLTGQRLSSSEGNFNIQLALKIHNLLK